MKKNLKIFWELLRINLKKSIIYRANFVVTFISIGLWIALYVVFFEVIFSHVDNLAGWSKGEALTLLAFYYLVQGISNVFFREGFELFSQKLIRGHLDQVMTKPASAQLMSFFLDMRIDHVLDLFITFTIFGYVQLTTDFTFSLPLLAAGFGLSVLGALLFYSVMLTLISLVFIFDRIDVISSTIWNVSQISRYPRGIYTSTAKVLVQFIFPVALIASVPAEVVVGRSEPEWIWALTGLSIGLFAFGSLLFHLGLRRYSSAN